MNTLNTSFGRQSGFSLIELMVALVIVGILTAVAIPTYHDHMRKSRIPDATSNLATKRVQLEQYFQDNRTYAPTAAIPAGAQACLPDTTTSQYFNFSCADLGAATYTLTATGKSGVVPGRPGAMQGFIFTVNQANTRTTTVAAPVPDSWHGNFNCWLSGKGTC